MKDDKANKTNGTDEDDKTKKDDKANGTDRADKTDKTEHMAR